MDKHVLERMQNIMDNLSNANLTDVTELLNYYNGDAVMINGTSYHPFNDPSTAARLNARYHELTGQDHPRFVEQAPIVIDGLMKDKDMLLQAGAYTPMYFDKLEQIKGNITKENKGIEITESHHPLQDFHDVLGRLDSASVEEVTQQLDYYNGDAVMINGTSYHPFNDPSTAARLNARYHELTGQDHPRFVEQAPIVIDGLMKDKDMLLQAGAYTPMYFDKLEQIKGNITKENKGIEITESHHPLQDFHDVLGRLDSASVEEVTQQLDYYNGDAVMINGTSYHPFNDPSTAARLNARYHELTGQDHPRFVEQAPIVIDGLMKDKDMLLQAGTYTPMYFDKLEQIKGNIASQPSLEENKKTFMEARDKQRQIDNVTRSQQIEAMNNTIQQSNEITQNFEASMDNNSMGGMSR